MFLTAQHIYKRFSGKQEPALNDVSISVPEGRIFGLLGPNGAGKTTLLRIINHITMPDSGEVTLAGHPLTADDVAQIGYLPEERGLYKKMKVGEQAMYLAQLKGLSRKEARNALNEWFECLGITAWWDKRLEELSKGMQQKVQFVVTVLHRPRLLIFDEPFSGFDPVYADLLKNEILHLRNQGHTILFSTHNMASVEEVCDEIALLNHGRVVLHGEMEELKRRYSTGEYEVVFRKLEAETLSLPNADILSEINTHNTTRFLLRKSKEMSVSDLVCLLAKQGELCSFSEKLPTMHEIFLQAVSDANSLT